MTRFMAHAVSWLFNPGFLILLILVMGVLAAPIGEQAHRLWLVAIGLATLVAIFILSVAWAHGLVIDVDLMTPMNLRDRSRIVVLFLGILVFLLVGSYKTAQPQPLHAILVTLLLLGLAVAAITLVWKISLHMLGVGMLAAAVLLIYGPGWWPVSLLVPLVSWARLRLRRHTPLQLVGGFSLGVLMTCLIFWWSGLI